MGDVVYVEDFKAAKVKRLEAEWDTYMSRAEAFQKEGKHKFASEMLAKAKDIRTRLDKLRVPKKKPVVPVSAYKNHVPFTYSFEGLGSADMGHRTSQIFPEPENN